MPVKKEKITVKLPKELLDCIAIVSGQLGKNRNEIIEDSVEFFMFTLCQKNLEYSINQQEETNNV